MSAEAYTTPQSAHEVDLHGQAVTIDTTTHLDEYEAANALLRAHDVQGTAIADIEAGNQRFAIVDMSEAPSLIESLYNRTYRPFGERTNASQQSPVHYEVEEGKPFMLLHFAQDGTVMGRALRSEEPITLGRTAHTVDYKSRRFNYEQDGLLSRSHVQIRLSPDGKQVQIADLQSTNGTRVRFSPTEAQPATQERTPAPETDVNQATITQELMIRPEFLPAATVEAGGRQFWLSKIMDSPNGYDQVVMYTTIEQQGKTVVVPRLLYKSHSDGGWRVAYGIEKSGRYVKEASHHRHYHYTQETKLAPAIVDTLEKLPVHHDTNGVSDEEIHRLFSTENSNHDLVNTAEREISYYTDGKVDPLMRMMRLVKAGYLDDNTLGMVRNDLGANSFSDFFKRLNNDMQKIPGFLPDFSQPPLSTIYRSHTLLGPIAIEDFPARYGDKRIIWSMASDGQGRVWIDNIRLSDAPISSYGTYATILDGGVLTSKPLDYTQHATGLILGQEYTRFFDSKGLPTGYSDITPALSVLLPTQQYRAQRLGK